MTDQPLALTVEQGLHAEQELLAAVCRGERDSGVLFWRPTDHALVMPRRMSRLDNFEAACSELAIAGWPVLLRETGGEPVPQSHSTVNVALVYVAPRSEGDHGRIENAYERLCLPLCDVLREWGGVASVGEIDGAFCDGRYNVNLNGRKLVGTAQRWRQGLGGKRPVVLVHGALLLDNDGSRWWRRSTASMNAATWSNAAAPTRTSPCMKWHPRRPGSSACQRLTPRCWRTCPKTSGYRRPPWSCP